MAKKEKVSEEEVKTEETSVKPEKRSGAQEEADYDETVSDMKAYLEAQEKTEVMLPLDIGEKLGAFVPVTINGYRLNVPKGVRVKVPGPVADILFESFNIYEHNSATPMRADRDETKDGVNIKDALS